MKANKEVFSCNLLRDFTCVMHHTLGEDNDLTNLFIVYINAHEF